MAEDENKTPQDLESTQEPVKEPTEEGEVAEEVGVVVRCSPQLNGAQRRFLRSMGHHLKVTVLIGDRGLHGNLYKQIRQGLLDHEILKLRWRGSDAEARQEGALRIHEQTGAQVVQILGKTILLYKEHPENPKLILPRRSKKRSRS